MNRREVRLIDSKPERAAYRGPIVVAIAALVMLKWSWGTWPDPLVDFGTQLYVPWQLLGGKVLYRDIAYYNGPLSQYVNAGWFALMGVGLRTLVWANLAVLGLAITLVYRLARRASGELAAISAGVVFAVVFAFSQGVGIGNFNWVTPYTNEITHGTVLGLIAIACLDRYQRGNRWRWLIAGGVALGLTFLTKAEPFVAAASASAVQLTAGLWVKRARGNEWLRMLAVFGASALAMPFIAVGLFAIAMPLRSAAIGVAGSWTWVFDSRITSLPFYRRVQGLDDVAGNLSRMLWWIGGYALVLVPASLIALWTKRKNSRLVSGAIFIFIAAILSWRFFETDWNSMILPLPVCLLAALVITTKAVIQRGAMMDRSVLRLALVVFSGALLAKIILSPHVYHYGFVLAMPGSLVLVAALAEDLPQWIERRGGCGQVLRTAALAAGLAGVAATIYTDAGFWGTKRWVIGSGADAFRVATRGLEVELMASQIDQTVPREGSVEVFPSGLMLNFLTRRVNPTKHVNFMPPEVLAAGEDRILAALADHPPDAIVINASTVNGDEFTLDADYAYGRKTLAWIRENYSVVFEAELPPPYPTFLHLVLMRPKTAVRVSLPEN